MSLVSVSKASQQLNMNPKDIETLVKRINKPLWLKKGVKRIPFDNSLSELYFDISQFISSHKDYTRLKQLSKVRKGNKQSDTMKKKFPPKNNPTPPSNITPPSNPSLTNKKQLPKGK